MKISLRKANAIQNSIQQALKSINLRTNIDISEFQDVEQELKTAREKMEKDDKRRTDLLSTLYFIRGLVGQANAGSNISLMLSQVAYMDKRIGQLEQIINANIQTDLTVLKGKLQKMSTTEDRYGRDSLSTSIVSQADIDNAKTSISELKKKKLATTDTVLELNIKTEIALTDDHVKVLQSEGIL